ncbi:MFS transporter [Oceanobacillus iheyensis]|uniref:MFS transporter n=1 Tax=Oceanobacillus iheyensis TaxID=182710 RepID=UPI00362CAC0E
MKSRTLIMAGLPMIAVTYGLSRFSFGLMLPYIRESLTISQSVSGVISSLSYFAYCIAIIMAMIFAVKIGSKNIIMIAGLFSITGLGLIAGSNNSLLLGMGVFIAGLSTGLASPPYADIVSTKINTDKKDQTNSWINSGTSIGTAFTGMIALTMTNDWRQVYIIFAIVAFAVLLVNYFSLPRKNISKKEASPLAFFPYKQEWKNAIGLISASILLGISSAAYWTFSRDYIIGIEQLPTLLGDLSWVLIGLSGLAGGTAGYFVSKIGLSKAYVITVIMLSTASLLLGLFPTNTLSGIISPILFGSSYIFVTGLLIVWGTNTFITNASFGLGVPFLLLALGQVFGSIIAGTISEAMGYPFLFIFSALIGYLTIFIWPKAKNKQETEQLSGLH